MTVTIFLALHPWTLAVHALKIKSPALMWHKYVPAAQAARETGKDLWESLQSREVQVITVELQTEEEPWGWKGQVTQRIKTKKHKHGKIRNLKWKKKRKKSVLILLDLVDAFSLLQIYSWGQWKLNLLLLLHSCIARKDSTGVLKRDWKVLTGRWEC